RPELYNLNAVKPPPLVPPESRFGVNERVTASGEVLQSLSEAEVARVVERVRASDCEAIAISLLFSFVHPPHERTIADAFAKLNVPISVSHQILPEYREYERTATVTVN